MSALHRCPIFRKVETGRGAKIQPATFVWKYAEKYLFHPGRRHNVASPRVNRKILYWYPRQKNNAHDPWNDSLYYCTAIDIIHRIQVMTCILLPLLEAGHILLQCFCFYPNQYWQVHERLRGFRVQTLMADLLAHFLCFGFVMFACLFLVYLCVFNTLRLWTMFHSNMIYPANSICTACWTFAGVLKSHIITHQEIVKMFAHESI